MANNPGKGGGGSRSTRRTFIKASVAGAAGIAALGPAYHWLKSQRSGSSSRVSSAGASFPGIGPSYDDGRLLDPNHHFPILPIGRETRINDYTGDAPMRPHGILWQKEAYLADKGGIPKAEETVSVVVIGGGMSGLTAAYHLREHKPLVLEQAFRLGGNSKGEDWRGAVYSIGAAYITPPEPGGLSHKLLSELKILPKARHEHGSEAFVLRGNQLYGGFWEGVTDRARASEFKRVAAFLNQVREHSFPDVPYKPGGGLSLQRFHELDRMTFKEWVQKRLGKIHPHIGEFLREYCWSSFGGGYDELSAAQALNFIASDAHEVVVFPGGNSYIAQALAHELKAQLPAGNIRTRTLAIDVRLEGDGVQVCYEDGQGRLRTVKAKACVFACGKFIGKHVVNGIPPQQRAAIDKLRYRAYTVANVLVNKKLASPGYELYHLTGKLPDFDSSQISEMEAAKSVPFTDLIFGTWAAHDKVSDRSVLTLYRSLPYDGGRPELYAPDSHIGVKAGFEKALPEALEALKLKESDVESLRVTRWGHAVPLAAKGLLADGTCAQASAPIGGRVFFSHQDNWANPCFETAIGAAWEAAKGVRKVLS